MAKNKHTRAPITIEFDVDSLDFGTTYSPPDEYGDSHVMGHKTLEEAVVEHVARLVVDDLRADRERWHSLRERINQAIDNEIEAQIEPMVRKALGVERELTDAFGEPTGQRWSLTKRIDELTQAAFSEPKDRGYGKGRTTLINHLVGETVDRRLTAEFTDAIEKGKADIKKALQAHASKILADTIVKQVAGEK